MWPKVIAQLFELLPHVTRLVPLADRFFQSKAAGEEANRKALDAMAADLRGDLGQVNASHAGIRRQLTEQGDKLTAMATEVHGLQASYENAELRLARVEQKLSTAKILLLITLLLNLVLVALIIFVLARHS